MSELEMQDKTLHITGMTCAACSNRIEKGLKKLGGVSQVHVNLATESASFSLDTKIITLADVYKKIEQLGYSASEKVSLEEDDNLKNKELKHQKIRLMFSVLLSLPLLWTMLNHLPFVSALWVPEFLMNPWVQFFLATPVQFVIGYSFYQNAFKAVKNKSADMNVLVVLGTSSAYFYSLYLTLYHNTEHAGHVDLYFETSAVLITLILLGKYLETKAKSRTSLAISALMKLQTQQATVLRNGEEKIVPIEDVVIGDIVFIKPGEKVAVDGVVIEGSSAVDESMITGESIPLQKNVGDAVIGSTINTLGSLKVRTEKVGAGTVLSQIIKTVEMAQGSKAPIQRFADVVAGYFVPIVLVISVLVFVLWYFVLKQYDLSIAIENMIAVLVIACPCALGLATPTSIMVGSGRAATFGVLFKGAEHLEITQGVSVILLDKTGTITKGKPEVTSIEIFEHDEEFFLSCVGSIEKYSEHPLADAIVKEVAQRGVEFQEVSHFESITGFGVQAKIAEKEILVGSPRLLGRSKIEIKADVQKKIFNKEEEGNTVIVVAIENKYAGFIAVADVPKESSLFAIQRLKEMGLDVIMVTGDNARTAKAIAKQVGIDHVYAEVLPGEKATYVKKYQEEGKLVAMVGDGINDAPALASADVGIAVGSGTDIANETAGVVLMRDDLNAVADALLLSKATMRNIKQNLFWALAYNCLAIPIAAGGYLAPWLAGAAMSLSSVSVVMNALRLQRIKISSEKK